MSDLKVLLGQRDKLLDDIKAIEELEGVENENNSKKLSELNLKKAKVNSQIDEVSSKLNSLKMELNSINEKVNDLSGSAVDKILEAIKEQRWYFFKNKPKVLMDKNTGLLWANLNYFPYCKENGTYYARDFSECDELMNNLNIDGFNNWRVPTNYELWDMIEDKTFPFQEGSNWLIKQVYYWFVNYNSIIRGKDLDYSGASSYIDGYDSCLLPCDDSITYDTYKSDVSGNNPIYTEKERLQFTLNLFINNELWPIFDDENITNLYKKIYFEKPKLLKELSNIQSQINEIEKNQERKLLSSEFDYTQILKNYDIESINNSIIKYYQAVISWVDDLIQKLDYYQEEKKDIITEFNKIGLKLSRKYEESPNLSDEENNLFKDRQRFFKKNFELGMNDVTKKLLSYKRQAQNIEDKIDEINESDDGITKLAELEEEKRASFSFVAENTATIVKNALIKMDYFEKNKDFAVSSINLWDKWSMDYKVLKTTYKEELKNSCEETGIEEEIWTKWFEDWCGIRLIIEKQFMPLIKEGLSGRFDVEDKGVAVIEDIVKVLQEYKEKVDEFYKNDIKGIYVDYAFRANGELQEKFEIESKLYDISSAFQSKLQKIIFSLEKNENKIFLINWANNLIDLPVDEIINFIQIKKLDAIPEQVLTQFMELKKKNFEAYLSDAKAYSKEQERRDKEFNALIFKMRKGIEKNKLKELSH